MYARELDSDSVLAKKKTTSFYIYIHDPIESFQKIDDCQLTLEWTEMTLTTFIETYR